MNIYLYLRRLKIWFLVLFVLLVLLIRNWVIDLPQFLPWFRFFSVNILFIGAAAALVLIIFKLIAGKVELLDRAAKKSMEDAKTAVEANTELRDKAEAFQRKLDELSTLHRINRAMNQTMELDKILSIILESICKYLNYERAILCLVDDEKRLVEARHAVGVEREFLGGLRFSFDDGDNFIIKAVTGRLPAIIESIPGKIKVFEANAGEKFVTAVMPLEARERVIGVIVVDNVKDRRKLEEKDLRALQTFTSQAALAVENARLYQTERNFKEELQRQVDIAVEKLTQAQAQLIQSEKLAALGQMAAVVTHEVRNPLSTIRGSAEIISKKVSADSPLKKFTEYIIQEVERLDLVVTEILTFSRKPQLVLAKENVNAIISQTLDFLEASDFQQAGIKAEQELSSKVPDTLLDKDQLKQVLLNIIQNACHFMEKMPERVLTIKTSASKSEIAIEVSDTGPGIPPDNIDRIFEPFFTTKVRGTGLGLSISKNIIESHGGAVSVRPGKPSGAVFTITLPVRK
jgi:signal transduction histidine kinase